MIIQRIKPHRTPCFFSPSLLSIDSSGNFTLQRNKDNGDFSSLISLFKDDERVAIIKFEGDEESIIKNFLSEFSPDVPHLWSVTTPEEGLITESEKSPNIIKGLHKAPVISMNSLGDIVINEIGNNAEIIDVYVNGEHIDTTWIGDEDLSAERFTYSHYGVFRIEFVAVDDGSDLWIESDKSNAVVWKKDPNLINHRAFAASGSINNYALFVGGDSGETVEYLNANFTKGGLAPLTQGNQSRTSANVGDYILFDVPYLYYSVCYSEVIPYDKKIDRQKSKTLSNNRYNSMSGSVGNYALFAGGYYNYDYYNTVDVFDTNLTRTTADNMSCKRYKGATANAGEYLLIAGGSEYVTVNSNVVTSVVDAYDSNLTRTTVASLLEGRQRFAGARAGSYALFAGGDRGTNDETATVEAYDANLTNIGFIENLTYRAQKLGATTLEDTAFFGGGAGGSYRNAVNIYSPDLIKSTDSLRVGVEGVAATTLGRYALFAGGEVNGAHYNAVTLFAID